MVHLFVHSANIYSKPGPDTTLDTEVTAGENKNNLHPWSLYLVRKADHKQISNEIVYNVESKKSAMKGGMTQ